MDQATINRYRDRLHQRLQALDRDDALNADSRKTVTLDQQSVGRLSRMDAMQQQAMAHATKARRDAERTRIAHALSLIDAGDYGYCIGCGDEIPPERLELAPLAVRCIRCSGA